MHQIKKINACLIGNPGCTLFSKYYEDSILFGNWFITKNSMRPLNYLKELESYCLFQMNTLDALRTKLNSVFSF